MFEQAGAHSLRDGLHDGLLRLLLGLIDSDEVLLRLELDGDEGGVEVEMLDALGQIGDVDGWDSVVAAAHDREGGELRVQTQPGTSVEFIEDIVGFTIAVGKA